MNAYRSFTAAIFTLTLLVLISGPALSEEKAPPPLVIEITAAKEIHTVKNGKPIVTTEPAGETVSGDVIIYTLTYKNQGREPLKGVKLVDPLPPDVVFVPGSVAGDKAAVTFSIDEGASFHAYPVKYKAALADGSSEERKATPDMITHIRWTLDSAVKPGASGAVSFKAKVK